MCEKSGKIGGRNKKIGVCTSRRDTSSATSETLIGPLFVEIRRFQVSGWRENRKKSGKIAENRENHVCIFLVVVRTVPFKQIYTTPFSSRHSVCKNKIQIPTLPTFFSFRLCAQACLSLCKNTLADPHCNTLDASGCQERQVEFGDDLDIYLPSRHGPCRGHDIVVVVGLGAATFFFGLPRQRRGRQRAEVIWARTRTHVLQYIKLN